MMYSLNEVGIIPAITSRVRHRWEVVPYTSTGKLPVFVSPMTCIVNDANFNIFRESKVIPIYPRVTAYTLKSTEDWQALSLEQFAYWFNAYKAPKDEHFNILIDVANGHMQSIYDAVYDAKQDYGNNLTVMIGNIANPKTYLECCKTGVDYVRIGIGGGNACTTGVQTGIHASIPWLITEIQQLKSQLYSSSHILGNTELTFDEWIETNNYTKTKIIADGGIDTIDKAIKCLALGADYVMMGKLFAQCKEACGELSDTNPYMRKYYGMASIQGQKDISKVAIKNPEGIETWVPIKYTLNEFLANFEAALNSCMSYCDAYTLDDFIGKVEYQYQTNIEFKSYYKL